MAVTKTCPTAERKALTQLIHGDTPSNSGSFILSPSPVENFVPSGSLSPCTFER